MGESECNGHRVSVWEGEKFWRMGLTDGCTKKGIYLVPLKATLNMENFMLHAFTIIQESFIFKKLYYLYKKFLKGYSKHHACHSFT